jgi:hypothetical protein
MMDPSDSRLRRFARRNKFWPACLVVAGIVIFASTPLKADMVSGRVYDSNGKPVTGKSFTVKNSKGSCVKQFDTDQAGNFGVFLSSGRYSVGYAPPNQDCSKFKDLGVIESYSQPVQQDIHLKRE